jgi:diaminopimelate epimerase
MEISFYKYQGTGNDFVMIDNRTNFFPKQNTDIISSLCDRHFGVGSDGVILIEEDEELDFKMVYFNADGSQTFCGNGGRCAVAFAKKLGMISSTTNFRAVDGTHYAKIENDFISLRMIDVNQIEVSDSSVYTFTGTQHHVQLVDDLTNFPVFEKGKNIRYSYADPGANVNFVEQINEDTFRVRTYEKGVENETLACGTGVTAVAVAMHKTGKTKATTIHLPVEGGELQVTFTPSKDGYQEVFLKGSAKFVFEGKVNI